MHIVYFCGMFFIDTHTHLYHQRFSEDRDAMLARSMQKGVEMMLLPNIDVASIEDMRTLHRAYPDNTRMMMGLHPCSVKADYKKQLDHIEKELRTGDFVAVGEFGIDLYWDKDFLLQQKDAFRIQVAWAKELNLPVVLHVREGFSEVFDLLDELNTEALTGVFHCFAGGENEVQKIVDYGNFYFGIGGVLTFRNGGLDKVLNQIPDDRLLLETDSPFLAPVPYRGKRNESAYIIEIAEKMAEVKNWSMEEVASVTTANARTLFKL